MNRPPGSQKVFWICNFTLLLKRIETPALEPEQQLKSPQPNRWEYFRLHNGVLAA